MGRPGATLTGMALSDDQWQTIGEAVYDHVTKEADARDKRDERFQRDLIDVHRQGWKQTAEAIYKGFGLIADAIRDHGRR